MNSISSRLKCTRLGGGGALRNLLIGHQLMFVSL